VVEKAAAASEEEEEEGGEGCVASVRRTLEVTAFMHPLPLDRYTDM